MYNIYRYRYIICRYIYIERDIDIYNIHTAPYLRGFKVHRENCFCKFLLTMRDSLNHSSVLFIEALFIGTFTI